MSRRRWAWGKFLPWAGIAGAALGGGLAHQIGSDTVLNDCLDGSPTVVLLACLLGLIIVGAGAFGSWIVWRGDREGPARRLIASVSLMTAALLAFAITLPMFASLIIPRCYS